MNPLSKKLRELEGKVLELPEDDEIELYVNDDAEMALHDKARRVKEIYRPEVEAFLNNQAFTFDQMEAKGQAVLNEMTEAEKHIINESHKFMRYRIMRLVFKFYRDAPSLDDSLVWQRIVWFFGEMDNLKTAKAIEDSEWNHNRNEDDPNFDDYKWWDDVEKKIREYYPKGVFTEESWEACVEYFDNYESQMIRDYWKAHPEEFKEYMEQIDKKLENLKSEQKVKAIN
jgi:hypothetical protein